ncbi:MAG: hypothetical protein MJ064_06290 [Lachnospiraceae bacterium]|nr:hypothetical protein [Lachnospiraceae bacterium]
MKNIKRILSLIIVMALLLTMMAVPAMAKDSDTNETDIIGSLYLSATPTTITVRGATGSYSFRIDDSTTWTTNATFSGLYPNTEHTVYAKLGSAPEITVGKITTKAIESTTNGAYIDSSASAVKLPITFSYVKTCSLNNSLELNFYVTKKKFADYSNLRLYVEKKQYTPSSSSYVWNTYILKPVDATYNGAACYKFILNNIAACEIGDDVVITLYAEDSTGATYISPITAYNVSDYCYEQLNSSDAKLKTVLVDLLNYATSAQTYFSYNQSNPINGKLTAAQKSLGTSTVPSVQKISQRLALDGAISKFFEATVSLQSSILFNPYFTYPSGTDFSNIRMRVTYTTELGVKRDYYVSAKNRIYKQQTNGGVKYDSYAFPVSDIAAPDFDKAITLTIYDGNTQISDGRIYSIQTYAYNWLVTNTTSDPALTKLMGEMMKYSASARTYFASK